jgi:hypothetical protein
MKNSGGAAKASYHRNQGVAASKAGENNEAAKEAKTMAPSAQIGEMAGGKMKAAKKRWAGGESQKTRRRSGSGVGGISYNRRNIQKTQKRKYGENKQSKRKQTGVASAAWHGGISEKPPAWRNGEHRRNGNGGVASGMARRLMKGGGGGERSYRHLRLGMRKAAYQSGGESSSALAAGVSRKKNAVRWRGLSEMAARL